MTVARGRGEEIVQASKEGKWRKKSGTIDRSILPSVDRTTMVWKEGDARCGFHGCFYRLSLSLVMFFTRDRCRFRRRSHSLSHRTMPLPRPGGIKLRRRPTVFFLVSFSPSPRPASICKFSARQGQQRRELLPAFLPLGAATARGVLLCCGLWLWGAR